MHLSGRPPCNPIHSSGLFRNLVRNLFRLAHSFRKHTFRLRLQTRFPSAPVPVLHVSVSLGKLRGAVDQVAAEEEVVLGRDSERVAHEDGGVAGQSGSHTTRDTTSTLAIDCTEETKT